MPRYARANTTQEELLKAILKASDGQTDLEDALYDVVYVSQVAKDLSKIESEYENISCEPGEFNMPGFTPGWDTIHGFAVLWIGLGGDAEHPFAAVLYLDNKNHIRAYIPKDGNCYDKKHKMAYGCMWWEEYCGEDSNIPYPDEDGFAEAINYDFDMDALRKDVSNRIDIG